MLQVIIDVRKALLLLALSPFLQLFQNWGYTP